MSREQRNSLATPEEMDREIQAFYDSYANYQDTLWEEAYSETLINLVETDRLYTFTVVGFRKYIQRATKNKFIDMDRMQKNRIRILKQNAKEVYKDVT